MHTDDRLRVIRPIIPSPPATFIPARVPCIGADEARLYSGNSSSCRCPHRHDLYEQIPLVPDLPNMFNCACPWAPPDTTKRNKEPGSRWTCPAHGTSLTKSKQPLEHTISRSQLRQAKLAAHTSHPAPYLHLYARYSPPTTTSHESCILHSPHPSNHALDPDPQFYNSVRLPS